MTTAPHHIPSARDRRLTIAILALTASVYCLMYVLTPPYFDDVYFKSIYTGFTWTPGNTALDQNGYMEYVRFFYNYDNIRLANLLDIFLLLNRNIYFLSGIFMGLCVTFIYWIIARLTCGSWWQPRMLCIVTFALAVMLPWRDSMFLRVYAMNYIMSTALFLPTFLLLLKSIGDNGVGKSAAAGITVLCVITAWMHEIFGVALLGGMGLITLVRIFQGKRIPFFWWIAMSLTAAVVTYTTCLTPGMRNRIETEAGQASIIAATHRVIIHNFPGLLLIATGCVGMLLRRTRKATRTLFSNPILVFITGSIIATTIISAITIVRPRSGYISMLMGVAGLIYLLCRSQIRDTKAMKYASIAAITAFAGIGASAIYWQHKLLQQNIRLHNMLEESSTGTVFTDIISREDVPWYTLSYPMRHLWDSSFQYISLDYSNMYSDAAVVPAILSGDLADNPSAKVINEELDIRMLDNAIYTDGKSIPTISGRIAENIGKSTIVRCSITYADGTVEHDNETLFLKFTGTDGKRYIYIKPYWRIPPRSEVVGISFRDESDA